MAIPVVILGDSRTLEFVKLGYLLTDGKFCFESGRDFVLVDSTNSTLRELGHDGDGQLVVVSSLVRLQDEVNLFAIHLKQKYSKVTTAYFGLVKPINHFDIFVEKGKNSKTFCDELAEVMRQYIPH